MGVNNIKYNYSAREFKLLTGASAAEADEWAPAF
jgi:hypothetical protein